jgi:hypothetical protein
MDRPQVEIVLQETIAIPRYGQAMDEGGGHRGAEGKHLTFE